MGAIDAIKGSQDTISYQEWGAKGWGYETIQLSPKIKDQLIKNLSNESKKSAINAIVLTCLATLALAILASTSFLLFSVALPATPILVVPFALGLIATPLLAEFAVFCKWNSSEYTNVARNISSEKEWSARGFVAHNYIRWFFKKHEKEINEQNTISPPGGLTVHNRHQAVA